PVAAATGTPAKPARERRRHRRGARRLARNDVRNDVFVASAAPDEAPTRYGTSPAYDHVAPPPPEERAPLAPGGSSTPEVPPEDVFGANSPAPAPAPSGGTRQPIAPEPIKLRPADLKIVWQGEDPSRNEPQRLDFSNDAGGHELSENEIDALFRKK